MRRWIYSIPLKRVLLPQTDFSNLVPTAQYQTQVVLSKMTDGRRAIYHHFSDSDETLVNGDDEQSQFPPTLTTGRGYTNRDTSLPRDPREPYSGAQMAQSQNPGSIVNAQSMHQEDVMTSGMVPMETQATSMADSPSIQGSVRSDDLFGRDEASWLADLRQESRRHRQLLSRRGGESDAELQENTEEDTTTHHTIPLDTVSIEEEESTGSDQGKLSSEQPPSQRFLGLQAALQRLIEERMRLSAECEVLLTLPAVTPIAALEELTQHTRERTISIVARKEACNAEERALFRSLIDSTQMNLADLNERE